MQCRNLDPLDWFPMGEPKERSMRVFMIAVILAAITQGTWAQEKTVTTDPMAVPNAEMSAEAELLMNLQEFAKTLEEAGFKEIQIVPQAILIQAKDKFDKPILMLFNPETNLAVQLQGPSETETTGSGSSDENQFRQENQR
jgi:hypothetical protein